MSRVYQNSSSHKSRLDYLDLCQEPAHLEIKLTASFEFELLGGLPFVPPVANLSTSLSHRIDNMLEEACVQRISDIFMTEYLPAIRQRTFGWSSVELPASMEERLSLDASITAGRAASYSPFSFPDPLTSTPTLSPHRELSVNDSLYSRRLSSVDSSFLSDFSASQTMSSSLLDLSIAPDCLEPSFTIASPQNVTIRERRREKTPKSQIVGLPADSVSVSRSGRMSGPNKRVGKFTVPLPNVSEDESDQTAPISISSDSSPGTPTNRDSTIASESLAVPRFRNPLRFQGKAPPFILGKKNDAAEALPSSARAIPAHPSPPLSLIPAASSGKKTISDDDDQSPISISSESSPGAPTKRNSTVASKSPTVQKFRRPLRFQGKAPPFIKKTLPSSARAPTVPTPACASPPSPIPAASSTQKAPRVMKRKAIQVVTLGDVEAAQVRSSRVKSNTSKGSEPSTPGPDLSISMPTGPRKLGTRAQKHGTSESVTAAPHAGNIQVQTQLNSRKDGLAVTNNFYLMAMDPFATAHSHARDAGYDRITAEIEELLKGCRVGSTTLDEIWMCIYQTPGYNLECWTANLAKNGVPENLFGPLLQIMTVASQDRRKTQW